MAKRRLADELLRGLTELRDALRDGKPMHITVYCRCEKCGKPVRAKETKGGWCGRCNAGEAK
jgi:hypothetical protein